MYEGALALEGSQLDRQPAERMCGLREIGRERGDALLAEERDAPKHELVQPAREEITRLARGAFERGDEGGLRLRVAEARGKRALPLRLGAWLRE